LFCFPLFVVANHIAPWCNSENDATKTAECTHAGITLIRVPHWWPGDLGSLANTIRHYRPDDVPSWVPRGDGIAAKPK
jgi:hypothetical protein